MHAEACTRTGCGLAPFELDPAVAALGGLIPSRNIQGLQHQPFCAPRKRLQQELLNPVLNALQCQLLKRIAAALYTRTIPDNAAACSDLPDGQQSALWPLWTAPERPSAGCHLLCQWPQAQHPTLGWWTHLEAETFQPITVEAVLDTIATANEKTS
ncbi:MAG: hypothetical protein FRX49_01310 [Trebouxia sp. A1-2]|nr:MAG: hypothetical protein FRX49_01310 [Trebouxia sp. A1-2]